MNIKREIFIYHLIPVIPTKKNSTVNKMTSKHGASDINHNINIEALISPIFIMVASRRRRHQSDGDNKTIFGRKINECGGLTNILY